MARTKNAETTKDVYCGKTARLAILVAALGYFVDVYDIVLFGIVRVESLKSLGVPPEEMLSTGVLLLNCQMIGMLLGGILWGIWGDKRGRIEVLFGSILLYSLANIANAFVPSVSVYAILRFLAGIGLAGEIGAGITLVSELLPKERRGYGTTIVATVGVSGAIAAGLIGDFFHWKTAYIVGGVMGLVLLLLRVSVRESFMFDSIKTESNVRKGDLRLLLGSRERITRYLSSISIGLPTWFAIGIVVTFCPEIGQALGTDEPLKAAKAFTYSYIGLALGDLASGLLSQMLRSRKKAIGVFMSLTLTVALVLLNADGISADKYYLGLLALGFFAGYWAVFITTSAEQFGTNLRATVATTAPNFVRGATVLMTLGFEALKGSIGVTASAQVVGLVVCAISAIALASLRETFSIDLNYLELSPEDEAANLQTQRTVNS
jgi:putative MFS transporter